MSDSTVVLFIGRDRTLAVAEATGLWAHKLKYANNQEHAELLEIFDHLLNKEVGLYRAELTELDDGTFEVDQSYFLKAL